MRAAPRPAVARAAGLVLALATLTGCGAGFEAQTYLERSSADATNVAVGPIAVRNVAIVPGEEGVVEAGSDADVRLTLVSVGSEDDRLVSASTEAAASVRFEVEGEEADEIVVPRLGTTGNTAGLVLEDVSEELLSGSVVEITLTFERAGEVVVQAPVATTGIYDEESEKSHNFHPPGEEEGETEAEGATGDTANEGEGDGDGGLMESGEETTESQN